MCLEPRAGRAWDGRPHVEGVRQTGGRSPTFFALGQRFTQLRNAPGNEWLPDCGCGSVRPACGYMGDAYAAFLDPDRLDRGQGHIANRLPDGPVAGHASLSSVVRS